MHNRTKLMATVVAVAIMLAAAVNTASARRIETSSQSFRAAWGAENKLTFAAAGGRSAICPVTLEGSFHSRTISKVSGQLIGYITRAALTQTACTFVSVENAIILNGTERLPEGTTTTSTLPWHILYISFRGTLPTISSIRVSLRGASFLLRAAGVTCLYEATTANPAFGEIEVNAEGKVTGLRAEEATRILKHSGSFLCPGEGTFAGTAHVTQQGNATAIFVRLVQ
jgi:hypothetical protein